MKFGKKKGFMKRGVSHDDILKLYPDLSRDNITMLISYGLDPDEPRKRCTGAVFADRQRIIVVRDGKEIESYSVNDTDKLLVDSGVGSSYVSLRLKSGEYRLLCRTDMSEAKEAIRAVKQFNRILDRGNIATADTKKLRAPKDHRHGGGHGGGHGAARKLSSGLKSAVRLWKMLKKYRIFIFCSISLFVAVSALNLFLPILNKVITDEYIVSKTAQTLVVGQYLWVIFAMLGVQVLVRLFSVFRSHLLIKASTGLVVDLRNMLFEKIQRLSISTISKRTAGELMRRSSHDISQIQGFLTRSLPSLIEQILLFAAVGIVFILSGEGILLLLILLPVPLVFWGFSFFFKKVFRLFRKCWDAGSKSNSILHDVFSGIRVVKSFGMEKRETERFSAAAAKERDTQIKSDALWYAVMPLMQFAMSFGEFIILFYVGNGILNGDMTLGEMSQFSMYASMLYTPLRMMSHVPREVINFLTSTSKVFEIIDEPDFEDVKEQNPEEFKGYIDIEGISFGYEGGGEVISHVDLHIEPGEFIGIVGRSGVGKSTLINLIMRMYDVEEGSIRIDGKDIRDISQRTLRSQMGVVLQETFLFSGTIYQNISYAKPDATREQIIATAKTAGCHDFIMKLPDGYETKVGEKGYTLSGGERQRIAIARALLHDPKILILDEATASLDTETEKQIQDAIANLSRSRTTIAIAHRLSTLRNATRLIVLDDGKIAEMGTHDELMQKCGIYYGLVNAQRQMSQM